MNSFLIHKPVGVVCATVDSNIGNIIRNKSDERYGMKKIAVPRPTVYDVANVAGFPNSFGLVGRLDTETSGIMLFTSHSDLLRKVRDPALSDEQYTTSYGNSGISYTEYCEGKSKKYELLLLSGKKVTSEHVANNFSFDAAEFESRLSEPFTFSRGGEECYVGSCQVTFLERFQDPKYSHGKPELGWCIRCCVVLLEGNVWKFFHFV